MNVRLYRSGFTLIELSIVLVIIGLIVGGILVGRDLIHAAELRATVSQIEKFDTAFNTFRTKYNCVPGDCSNAATLGFICHAILSGIPTVEPCFSNGNGLIDTEVEASNAWEFLSQANLVANVAPHTGLTDGYAVDLPYATATNDTSDAWPPFQAQWAIFYFSNATVYQDCGGVPCGGYNITAALPQGEGHYYWANAGWETDDPMAVQPVLSPYDAYAIDLKLDDGYPRSGRIVASGTQIWNASGNNFPLAFESGNAGPAGATSNYCITNQTPYQYNVANISRVLNGDAGSLCTIAVKAQF